MSVFHSVPGVPCAKMEHLAGVDTQTCALPDLKLRTIGEGFWGEVTVCLCRTHINLINHSLNQPNQQILCFSSQKNLPFGY